MVKAVILGLIALNGLTILYLLYRRDRWAEKESAAVLENQWAYIQASEDFIFAVLEDHYHLVHYDDELRELAERVAKAYEALRQDTHDNCSEDDYQSPLREFL